MGRKLAIGDIHGCLTSLKTLLEVVSPTSEDKVILLGDYVDRGPQSRQVIDYILAWPWEAELITLKGNHEMIMEEAALSREHTQHWARVGGVATLRSYDGMFKNISPEHWAFIQGGLPYYETKKYIYVHGGVSAKEPLAKQDQIEMAWRRFPDAKKHISGKTVICGHTIQRKGIPSDKKHTVCIDTGACRGGWLTCFEAKTRQYWQANEKGKARIGQLVKKTKLEVLREEQAQAQEAAEQEY